MSLAGGTGRACSDVDSTLVNGRGAIDLATRGPGLRPSVASALCVWPAVAALVCVRVFVGSTWFEIGAVSATHPATTE